jgi:hypothetical protein
MFKATLRAVLLGFFVRIRESYQIGESMEAWLVLTWLWQDECLFPITNSLSRMGLAFLAFRVLRIFSAAPRSN